MKNKVSIKKALYAGSFDPFTNGHLDIVKRSLKVFDELYIVVAIYTTKNPLIGGSLVTAQSKSLFLVEKFETLINRAVLDIFSLAHDYLR